MTKKEDAFVEQYFIERFNGTRAAIAAGYSARSAAVTASRLLRKANVSEAIAQRMADLKMTADEVLINLTEQARSDMADFVSVKTHAHGKGDKQRVDFEPYIDLKKAMDNGKLHLVKKLKITVKTGNTNERTTEIELYDKQVANTLMGKHRRLFAEKIEVDWAAELAGAGLDANAVEDDLTKLFKQHLTGGAKGANGVGAEKGETSGGSRTGE